mmetsp:Transcript_7746/g.23274  ORF Transcript_7746/g.23274 Transcript_7746/m.23274 type:complete len:660 (-) Transcript_7746:2057-4036(-)
MTAPISKAARRPDMCVARLAGALLRMDLGSHYSRPAQDAGPDSRKNGRAGRRRIKSSALRRCRPPGDGSSAFMASAHSRGRTRGARPDVRPNQLKRPLKVPLTLAQLCSTCSIASDRRSLRTGFDKKPSMPHCWHSSRSFSLALAVIARMGTAHPSLRIARVASTPPITGIDMSISTTSNGATVNAPDGSAPSPPPGAPPLPPTPASVRSIACSASSPLAATSQCMPRLCSILRATVWLMRLSSTSNARRPRTVKPSCEVRGEHSPLCAALLLPCGDGEGFASPGQLANAAMPCASRRSSSESPDLPCRSGDVGRGPEASAAAAPPPWALSHVTGTAGGLPCAMTLMCACSSQLQHKLSQQTSLCGASTAAARCPHPPLSLGPAPCGAPAPCLGAAMQLGAPSRRRLVVASAPRLHAVASRSRTPSAPPSTPESTPWQLPTLALPMPDVSTDARPCTPPRPEPGQSAKLLLHGPLASDDARRERPPASHVDVPRLPNTTHASPPSPRPAVCASACCSGIVNQNTEPRPKHEYAPMRPPRTPTCLEQMLNPRPVPPLVRGFFISSSVPCTYSLNKALRPSGPMPMPVSCTSNSSQRAAGSPHSAAPACPPATHDPPSGGPEGEATAANGGSPCFPCSSSASAVSTAIGEADPAAVHAWAA